MKTTLRIILISQSNIIYIKHIQSQIKNLTIGSYIS
jgi:hypothetical protein